MSDKITIERTKLLSLCRNFVKAELEQIVSGTEVNKSLAEAAWKKLAPLVKDKPTARSLASSQVAKQYLKG